MSDILNEYKPIGFIGSGNMATAIMHGLISSKLVKPNEIIASNSRNKELPKLKEQGVQIFENNNLVAQSSKTIIIAVKPNMVTSILEETHDGIKDKLVISVAAGVKLSTMEKMDDCAFIRVMPNTAVLIGEGCVAITAGRHSTATDVMACKAIFTSVSKVCEEVSEDNIDSMIGISGSGIAFMYVIAEALADAGVKMGLSRSVATALASQTMIGAGKMIQETGQHPMQLKDNVASPGGSTICGLATLEELGLRHALIRAAEVTKERARSMAAESNR